MERSPTMSALDPAGRALAQRCLEWSDQWWDDERALPWGPPGHEAVGTDGRLHLIPQAGWYAVGLFLRDEGDDRDRARRVIDAVCSLQYDEPGTDWHGTYPIFAEWPHPPTPAEMWTDYDPNWRQFLGLSWVLLLLRFGADLPEATRTTLERAVRLGVEGEPPDRCPPTYTNIALKRAAYESIAGELLDEPAWTARAEALAEQVAGRHDRYGAFEEFNSPTYYGVDLFALALARQHSPSETIRQIADPLEASLWRSISGLYHPVLANLCAPWTRTYGMDMHSYVAKLMLPLALVAPDATPAPGFASDVAHGHDLFAGAITALVGTQIPDDAHGALTTFAPHAVEQPISRTRTATAWLDHDVMAGAEACESDLSWWDQYVGAAMHWRRPDGGVGWLSVRMPGPSAATAVHGRLDVPTGDGGAAVVTVGGDVDRPTDGRWALPGIDLEISCDLTPAGDGRFGGTEFVAPVGADVRITLA